MPHIRYTLPVAVLTGLALAVTAAKADEPEIPEDDALVQQIVEARKTTWRWQDVMQRQRTEPDVSGEALSTASTEFKERSLAYWRKRAKRVFRAAQTPPHERAFRCIHRHEAPWKANTGNGYYGGLQMDLVFQRMYGRGLLRGKGRAHRWTPLEQIWVAERAVREGRGFHPWPVAARRCGLI
jgi:Transglycosylase-like domain